MALRRRRLPGWSTKWLASSVARQAIIGSGFEAYYHAKALATLGGVQEFRIWARNRLAAEHLAHRLRLLPQFRHIVVRVSDHIKNAVWNADVITTVTASPVPLIAVDLLPKTVLINAMGAFRPTTRELTSDVVREARLYADSVPACLAEAGDYLIPAEEGLIDLHQVRPLSQAQRDGAKIGRTIMKSVGSALFDIICAECLVRQLYSCIRLTKRGPV